ncbi:MAG: adenosine deaminase [Gammaproteobacteria bacterium]
MKKYIIALLVSLPSIATAAKQVDINTYFESIKNNPTQLSLFITAMPKGGDLHDHMDAAVGPVLLWRYGVSSHLCLDPTTLTAMQIKKCPAIDLMQDIKPGSVLYDQTLDAWSMRDFNFQHSNGAQHFFATFGKSFQTRVGHRGDMLAAIVTQAANEHISYLELMINPDEQQGASLANGIQWPQKPSQFIAAINKRDLQKIIAEVDTDIQTMEQRKNQLLACHTSHSAAGCHVTVRYIYQVIRTQSDNALLANLVEAFQLAATNPKVVGINLVGEESDPASMINYRQLMQYIALLRQHYPTVNVSLHAGELEQVATTLPYHDSNAHIKDALEIANANRIGHGVDIMHEKDYATTLHIMAVHHIPVEINLTSNADILGIQGQQHPFMTYLQYQVPMVISTDDQGILDTNLTQEFIRAVNTYHLNYSQLKMFVRNSIMYSFLPGASLWQDDHYKNPVAVCSQQNLGSVHLSVSCLQFIKQSQKAQQQWLLEQQLQQFEQSLKKLKINKLKN